MKRTPLRRSGRLSRRREPRRRAAPHWTAGDWEGVTEALLRRQASRCLWCGMVLRGEADRHHRLKRRDGGDRYSNLALLHPGCHHWLHEHPTAARDAGLILRVGDDPASAPLVDWSGRVWVLDDLGHAARIDIPPRTGV